MIKKAPILFGNYANREPYQAEVDQRDADHKHYLKEFIKWLEPYLVRISEANGSIYLGFSDYIIPQYNCSKILETIRGIREALKKGAEENE